MSTRLKAPRRRITNDQDRYGGYNTSLDTRTSSRSTVIDNEFTDYSDANSSINDFGYSYNANVSTYDIERSAIPAPQEIKAPKSGIYSQRTGINAQTEIEFAPAKTKKRNPQDIMPSIETEKVAKQRARKQKELERKLVGDTSTAEEKTEKKALSKETSRVMLFVYMLAIIMLSIAVVATGIAINSTTAEVTSLQEQILAYQIEVATNEATLLALSDPDEIAAAAENIGMVDITDSIEVSLVSQIEEEVYQAETNAFDEFCDWLSNIIF